MTGTLDQNAGPAASPADDVEGRLVGALNGAAVALTLSIGHRTGLLDALAATGPVDAEGLAAAAGCHPRYVREWLGAMTTGGLLQCDPAQGSYRFVPGAADLLTRAAPANLAAIMQFVAVLGAVEDGIVECFRTGGGLGYEYFPRFHEVMAEDSSMTVLAALDDAILPLVPGLADRLTAGIDVLDVGCGQGRAITALARRFPRSRFSGLDLDAGVIETATRGAEGLSNITFRQMDAVNLAEALPSDSLDLVFTFDAIHDQAHPDRLLAGIRHVLRPDGVYLAQDIASSGAHHSDVEHPLGPFLYTISTMHCMTVSLAVGGVGLGTMWGIPAAREHFAAAGFGNVEVHALPHDVQNVFYVCRP